MRDPLLSIAEELYALAPAEFTGTRNAWAKQAKADGDAALARRVAELRKPSLPAWVVNMLMRHQGEEMAQVLDLGASLRQAQADLDGEALRDLTRQRRQLTTAVTHQGRVLAGQLGQKVTDAVADQVQSTLHAAMVDEDAAAAVRSGLLVAPLAATGVGGADVVDAVAVPSAIGITARPRSHTPSRPSGPPERPGLSVVTGPEPDADQQRRAREAEARAEHEAERRSAQEAVDAAVADADEAQRRVRKADKRVARVQARTLQTADELDQTRRRIAELEHELERLDDEAAAAEEKRERARERYASAQQVLEAARAARAGLGD